jgi:preprotein translocase subunit SecD
MQLVDHADPFMSRLCAAVRADSKAPVSKIEVVLDSWMTPDGRSFQQCYLGAPDRVAMLTPDQARAEGCIPVTGQERSECVVSGKRRLQRYLARLADEGGPSVDELHELVFERTPATPDEEQPYWRTYYVQRAPIISGADIQNASVADDDPSTPPEVELEFTEEGRERFARETGTHVGHKLAIVYDGTVQSAPIIQSKVSGGRARIYMGPGDPATVGQQARDLVLLLETGALPAPLLLSSEELVGEPPAR